MFLKQDTDSGLQTPRPGRGRCPPGEYGTAQVWSQLKADKTLMLWLFLFVFLIRVNIFAFEIYFLSTLNITYIHQKLHSCNVLNSILLTWSFTLSKA